MTEPIKELPFPWTCGKCRQQAVERETFPYSTDVQYDGRIYSVELRELHAPRCKNCGAIVLDDRANDQIMEALRHQIGLLMPEQIRKNRESLGLRQRDFANLLGVGESTVSRWETGAQIQQRSLDKLMRLCFAFPQARDALADKDWLADLGSDVAMGPPIVQPDKAQKIAVGRDLGDRPIDEPTAHEPLHTHRSETAALRWHSGTHEPVRSGCARTAEFYSRLLRSCMEEREKTDPGDLLLESVLSSRCNIPSALEAVPSDVASLLPMISCWAALTDSTTRSQWRNLFERAVRNQWRGLSEKPIGAFSDRPRTNIAEAEISGRWFAAPLRSIQQGDLEQSARLSRFASRLDILPEAKRESVLLQFETLTELMVP